MNRTLLSTLIFVLLFTQVSLSHDTYPEIDEQTAEMLIKNMSELMEMTSDPDFPVYSDAHYRARLLEMSGEIQYRLTSDIKNHIKHRTEKYRSATERTLGLSEMYFPIFEEYLARKDIPHHLKYLPIVESNLNAVAKSHASAVGLWQFISGTGRLYGLRITSYLDERSDTHKASNAAATMLASLYKRYNDWPLALAAYNCGPGRVDKYVKGTQKDFWDIRSMLPRETQMYVPYFMAVAYSYEFHHLHQLKPRKLPTDLVLTDTLHLQAGYKSLSQLARQYNINRDTLKRLNPGYIKNYIPSSQANPILVLPCRIVSNLRNYRKQFDHIMAMKTNNPIKCIRRVNSNADLAFYMKAHRCSMQDILFWNGLSQDYQVQQGDIIAIRKYCLPQNQQQPVQAKKDIETISIHALKVLSMDKKARQSATTPVYLNVDKIRFSNVLPVRNVVPYQTIKQVNNPNLQQNTPQVADKAATLTHITTNRSRARRLRAAAAPKQDNSTLSADKRPAIQAVKSVSGQSKPTNNRQGAVLNTNNPTKDTKLTLTQLTQLGAALQSKEQAVIRAKRYSRTSAEEKAAIKELSKAKR